MQNAGRRRASPPCRQSQSPSSSFCERCLRGNAIFARGGQPQALAVDPSCWTHRSLTSRHFSAVPAGLATLSLTAQGINPLPGVGSSLRDVWNLDSALGNLPATVSDQDFEIHRGIKSLTSSIGRTRPASTSRSPRSSADSSSISSGSDAIANSSTARIAFSRGSRCAIAVLIS